MKTLFEQQAANEVLQRLDKLTPETKAVWGKMNVSQMLAHCSLGLESALGMAEIKRTLMGKIMGPMFKNTTLGPNDFPKGGPTAVEFNMLGKIFDFNNEKEKLSGLIKKFNTGGQAVVTNNPHSFFGKFSKNDWARLMYKHLDHHFKQFGV